MITNKEDIARKYQLEAIQRHGKVASAKVDRYGALVVKTKSLYMYNADKDKQERVKIGSFRIRLPKDAKTIFSCSVKGEPKYTYKTREGMKAHPHVYKKDKLCGGGHLDILYRKGHYEALIDGLIQHLQLASGILQHDVDSHFKEGMYMADRRLWFGKTTQIKKGNRWVKKY